MDQYRPCWKVSPLSESPVERSISRPVTREEYRNAIGYARDAGLRRGFG